MADEPVESSLGPTDIGGRLPPLGARPREERRRERHKSSRMLRLSTEEARRELQAEIKHGNEVLAKRGHRITLELIPGSGNVPDRVAVCLPAADGSPTRCVSRAIRRWQLQEWLARLEGLEGLLVDTER
ncbi:MAG TPA: hypothetical protein PK280_19035 [Planctomycetota bacterium]|nr:hypothetical protein [Planctomycetota bacterium]